MKTATFIIGGCRSGKSSHALQLANAANLESKVFIATCIPQDEEMQHRVQRHQSERGPHWQTVEEPVAISEAIAEYQNKSHLILVDCLTLWISNVMLQHESDDAVHNAIGQLCRCIETSTIPVILVSNEVGGGIVPDNALARRYRDLVGRANQHVARACRQVVWMVAGIPVTIKDQ